MDPYVGEIRLFAGNYAPQSWFMCNGQELSIVQYQLLFAVIGNAFGGTGSTTFKLPDFAGRAPLHRGQGQNLTARNFADAYGEATVTLTTSEMPQHTHIPISLSAVADGTSPEGKMWANTPRAASVSTYATAPNVQLSPTILGSSGGSQAHNNMQPYVAINYIICYDGIYPEFQD